MTDKRIFSNSPLDYNQVKCMACHANVKVHHFKKHLKSHKKINKQMPITLHEYKEKHGTKWEYIWKAYHECRICGTTLLFDLTTLFKHIKNHHGQTKVKDYINLYIYIPEDSSDDCECSTCKKDRTDQKNLRSQIANPENRIQN